VKRRTKFLGVLVVLAAGTAIAAAGYLAFVPPPADPQVIVLPVFDPLANGERVTVHVISVNGTVAPGGSLQRSLARFGRAIKGELEVVEAEPVQLDLGSDGAMSDDQLKSVVARCEGLSPFAIPVVVAPDFETDPWPASYRYSYRGEKENWKPHLVTVNARQMKAQMPVVPYLFTVENGWELAIGHELFHALGVPSGRSHAWAGGHCTHTECVMYPRTDLHSACWDVLHLGPSYELCETCLRELEESRSPGARQVWEATGDHGLAWLNRYVELNAEKSNVYRERLKLYLEREQYAQALPDIERLMELEPAKANYHRIRGSVRMQLGALKDAVADFETALQIDANNVATLNAYAWLLATASDDTLRDGKRGVEYATRACELSGWKKAAYLDTLGCAYAEAGDFEAAVQHENKALELHDEENEKEIQGHLELFKARKPFRDTEPIATAGQQ
jgi:hypothetical protein